MPVAAVPDYLGRDFSHASPGMRFGMYLKLWVVNRRSHELLWTTHDIGYEVRGQQHQEREVKYENKVSALSDAKRLNDNDKNVMRASLERQRQTFDAIASSATSLRLDALATAPFTTGLGNEHPLENGFAFLNPYGLPYLPGSGIKGVLRQAARELASGEWDDDTEGWSDERRYPLTVDGKLVLDSKKQPVVLTMLDVLFGRETPSGESDHVRGALSFWDVIPQIEGDSLMVEIMTPHQKHYYQDGGTPHESGQPSPISFLTVPPDSRFVFHVQCDLAFLDRLAPDLARDGRWKTLLQEAFEHAFKWLGFGAKTAAGYGAMTRLSDEEVARTERESRKAALRCEWVDEKIKELAAKNRASEADTLRGRGLAEAWAALADTDLKTRALADIRARWESQGWWAAPPGGAAKKARAIYDGTA